MISVPAAVSRKLLVLKSFLPSSAQSSRNDSVLVVMSLFALSSHRLTTKVAAHNETAVHDNKEAAGDKAADNKAADVEAVNKAVNQQSS